MFLDCVIVHKDEPKGEAFLFNTDAIEYINIDEEFCCLKINTRDGLLAFYTESKDQLWAIYHGFLKVLSGSAHVSLGSPGRITRLDFKTQEESNRLKWELHLKEAQQNEMASRYLHETSELVDEIKSKKKKK